MKCPHNLTLIYPPQVALYEYTYRKVAKISHNKLFLVISSSFYFILQNSPHRVNVIVFVMKTNEKQEKYMHICLYQIIKRQTISIQLFK